MSSSDRLLRRVAPPIDLEVIVRQIADVTAARSWGVLELDCVGADAQVWLERLDAHPMRRLVLDRHELDELGRVGGQIIDGTIVALRIADDFVRGASVDSLIERRQATIAVTVDDGEWISISGADEPDRAAVAAAIESALRSDVHLVGPAPSSPLGGSSSGVSDGVFAELDVVRLRRDVPELGLRAGDLGAIVLVNADDAGFEVEFVRDDGSTRALGTFLAGDLEPDDGPPTS